jgi:hypothetical protein
MSTTSGSNNSTSGSNSSTSGSNNSSGGSNSSTGGSTAGGSSISDLTNQLKGLQKDGPADVKLSTATRDKYLQIIAEFRSELQAQLDAMKNVGQTGFPGWLVSALQTQANLVEDVTGLSGIEPAITQYLNYLDEFETTVKDAANNLIKSG